MSSAEKPEGMSKFDYLACDGGPHLVLPKGVSQSWKGIRSPLDALNPASEYGKALGAAPISVWPSSLWAAAKPFSCKTRP